MTNNVRWQDNIRTMLMNLVGIYELPEGSIYLSDNKSQKDPESTISYSICIWEPDYPRMPSEKPGQNKLVVTITPSTVQSRPDDVDLILREDQVEALEQPIPEDAEVLTRTKSDIATNAIRARFKKDSASLINYLWNYTRYSIENYVSKVDRFGCCGLYEKCSDAGKCIHENKLYSKACFYRSRLERGCIYYGKNRTIDREE